MRETWKYNDWTEDGYPFIRYRADRSILPQENIPEDWGDKLANEWARLSVPENYQMDGRAADRIWRSPIHMPKWAARIWREITDVRVERVQEISANDIESEGTPEYASLAHIDLDEGLTRRGAFSSLWNEINAKRGYPWESNPWVWVIKFRGVEL